MVNLSQAAKLTGKSRNTIKSDLKKGVLSGKKDDKGHWVIDVAELTRVYDQSLINSSQSMINSGQSNDQPIINSQKATIHVLEQQIDFLKTQLERSEQRYNDLMQLHKDQQQKLIQSPKQKSILKRLFRI